MELPFQCATLVSAPCFPNSIAWSDENLIAVASGRLVTILNPTSVLAPRGTIGITSSTPLPIGVVCCKDLLDPCLLPITVSRDDNQPFVRSLAWSPLGLAPNFGCLLSVCDTDGRVKLYTRSINEYSSEWTEVADISKLLCDYHLSDSFRECVNHSPSCLDESVSIGGDSRDHSSGFMSEKNEESSAGKNDAISNSFAVYAELVLVPFSTAEFGVSVEVLKEENCKRVWMAGTIQSFKTSEIIVALNGTIKIGSVNAEKIVGVGGVVASSPSKVRPLTKLGILSKEILYVRGLKKVLKTGQLLEVWQENRWVEGSFMRLNKCGLMVKLSGSDRGKTVDPVNVRLSPVWNDETKSWQFTLLKIAINNQASYDICNDDDNSFKTPECSSKGESMEITPKEYACRHQMISSLVVAWSPKLFPSIECGYDSGSSCPNRCAILAVGGKSGKISLWRVHEPQNPTIERGICSIDPLLVGILHASNAWVSVLSWEVCISDSSNPRCILAMGSADGSAKIWSAGSEKLRTSTDVISCFSLLKELKIAAPVSTISLVVPVKSSDKIQLAIGGGSGSVDVWICNISCDSYCLIGHFDTHQQVVTGLSWTSNGSFLYSSYQDNSLCCWALCGTFLKENVFPSAGDSGRTSNDLPLVFDSCFGMALSPGNLMIAVVYCLDVDLLDPMYQARTQKAAVAYRWTGGLSLQIQSDKINSCGDAANSLVDVQLWETSILNSLQQYEDVTKPLVLWDIVAVLKSLYLSVPDMVENLVVKWLVSWSDDCLIDFSFDNILLLAPDLLKKSRTRSLHLLNIVCRRVFVIVQSKKVDMWTKLLFASEKELRERLVAIHFYAFLAKVSPLPNVPIPERDCAPVGLGLMKQWIDSQEGSKSDRLSLLATKIATNNRTHLASETIVEEKCIFCASTVPFESPEYGICRGDGCSVSGSSCHKLSRCAVSMQICPLSPSLLCVCCQRSVSNLVPSVFFTISASSYEFSHETENGSFVEFSNPLCPFCGILLQKNLPQFLLSPCPV